MIRHLSLLIIIAGLASCEEAKTGKQPVLRRDATLAKIEADYAAIQQMAAKHNGVVQGVVTGAVNEVELIVSPYAHLGSGYGEVVRAYLVFKPTKVLSGAMTINDDAQTFRMFVSEVRSFGIQGTISPPSPERYGFTTGQVLLLRYSLGIADAEKGIEGSELQYHFSLIKEP